MSITNFSVCPICGTKLKHNVHFDRSYVYNVNCPACGRFAIDEDYYDDVIDRPVISKLKSEIASYLFYQNDRIPFPFLCGEDILDVPSNHRRVSLPEILNRYPKTFSEKVDLFLLGLSSRASFMSDIVDFSFEQLVSACFANRNPSSEIRSTSDAIKDQINFLVDYLVKQEYVDSGNGRFIIMPKGLERIDFLQQNRTKDTKNVFVAMSFAPDMAPIRDAIKSALTQCGYIPRIMDEIEHNHQIVPEMLYEIREARFVVAELTGHNNGAYFEAGYALGFGKEVIQICEKSKFGTDGHFDVKQVNTILWEDTNDLANRLIARIKATIT